MVCRLRRRPAGPPDGSEGINATESTRDRRAGQRGLRRCGCQEAAARPNCLIAGKAYDVDRLRTWPKARHIEAAMSLIAPRTGPSPPEPAAYRRRNLVERLFGRLKNGRRIVTRYDRLARSDLAGSALIAVVTEWTL